MQIARRSWLRSALWLFALCLVTSAAVPGRALAQTAERPAAASALPSDGELEAAGARIGRVHIRTADVFDLDDPAENRALYRWANRVHRRTRTQVLREQLLFRTGDVYSRRLLDESARLLRSRRYLGEATIEPVRYRDGLVDIEVRTRDVWSLNPGLSFGRRGGADHYGIEIEEINLLGSGIELALEHDSDVDRSTSAIGLVNRQAWGGRNQIELRYADHSDGDGWLLAFERPFQALDSRWAAGARLQRIDQVDRLYQLGEEFDRYRRRARIGEAYWGRSTGLADGWASRWSGGFTQDEQTFSSVADSSGSGLLPSDRELRYPWIGVELLQDDYARWRNRDQIGRTEDILLGLRAQARLGYAAASLGSDRNAWIFQFAGSRGVRLGALDTLLLRAGAHGRRQSGRTADLLIDANARYYHPISDARMVFAELDLGWGRHLGLDQTLLLGGDNGLRGYPLRYQGGERRALLSVEQRWYSDWYPWRLFRVGAAGFVDVGRTWGDDGLGTPNYGWLSDVGVGLRLGNNRSALGNVIHIDLAFPLDGPGSIERVQLLVEAHREF